MSTTLSEFRHFLAAAKRATYAAQGDSASVAPRFEGSKQLEHREGAFFYRDVYFGLLQFVGQELVYRAERPVWSMSYAGGLHSGIEPAQARPVYAFLRQALLEVPSELPVRGPGLFEEGELCYVCQVQGTIERFHGIEVISRGGQVLYELHFAGGQLA